MNKPTRLIWTILVCYSLALIINGCKSKTSGTAVTTTDSPATSRKKKDNPLQPVPAKRAPVINIIDTISVKMIVLYIKDSAATSDRISAKLAGIYGFKLPEFIKKNKLKITGPPVAWYRSSKAPVFFEAGLIVDKRPAKLAPGIFVRSVGGDSAVMAHFFGPYELTTMAYDAMNDFISSKKKHKAGMPYELYVSDPYDSKGKPVDPYKVQTDIIFPYK